MSCYEWSRGDIVLPSAEFAPVRLHLQQAMTKKYESMFAATQQFWSALTSRQKADIGAYKQALASRRFEEETTWMLEPKYMADRPRRVLRSDIDWPNNRTVVFHERELTISFDRKTRTVTYDVAENNHAREHASATVLSQQFYERMSKVKWTHGTGGVILGNDEYHREAERYEAGSGGSYVVDAFGYLGVREAPEHVGDFLNGKGQWVHVEVTFSRTGYKGKVVPGRKPAQSVRWR